MRLSVLLVAISLPVVASQSMAASGSIMYECTDANGGKQFTNVPDNPKACRALNISVGPPASPPAGMNAGKASPARASATPTPASFPRVDRETQQTRDNDRRRILEHELANEQKLLDDAKRELATQESQRLGDERNYQRVLDRLEPFKKKVKQHQDNVDAIRREMASIR